MVGGFLRECDMITNKIYAIIGARSGSKSIVDKNIQDIEGKPLIAYSILTARFVPEIDRIIVSTDSARYREIAIRYKAEVPFLQPESVSKDSSCDIDWIKYLLDWLEDNEKELPEYLVHLRPTSPLRDFKYISLAIQYIKKHPEATALRSCIKMSQSVYKHFKVQNGFLKTIGGSLDLDEANKPRHLYPTTYDANGYVDILKTDYILSTAKTKIHGNKVLAFHVPYIIDVDEKRDLEHVRMVVRNG